MNHEFLIFLIAIFCLSFSNQAIKKHKETKVDGKVLYIRYYEDIHFKILKDYKNKKKAILVYDCATM